MNNTFSISAVLSVLTGLMLFGVCGNIQVYAQPSSSLSADSSSTISPQVKAIMCDPSNPSLKIVNTTEAHVCGIPKTVKPSLSSSTPPTSAVSSIVATPSKPREITTTSNNVAVNTGIAPISNPATRQLSSTTTPTIAPQAIHQQQQQEQQSQPQILPLTTTSNNTIALNNTLATTSPLLGPGQLTFLGFHGSDSSSRSDNGDGSSSHSSSSHVKHSSDTKSTHSHSTSSSSSHSKSSSHSDHGGKSSSSAGSSIGDKVRSVIRHALD